jgi:hypothetical protein
MSGVLRAIVVGCPLRPLPPCFGAVSTSAAFDSDRRVDGSRWGSRGQQDPRCVSAAPSATSRGDRLERTWYESRDDTSLSWVAEVMLTSLEARMHRGRSACKLTYDNHSCLSSRRIPPERNVFASLVIPPLYYYPLEGGHPRTGSASPARCARLRSSRHAGRTRPLD